MSGKAITKEKQEATEDTGSYWEFDDQFEEFEGSFSHEWPSLTRGSSKNLHYRLVPIKLVPGVLAAADALSI